MISIPEFLDSNIAGSPTGLFLVSILFDSLVAFAKAAFFVAEDKDPLLSSPDRAFLFFKQVAALAPNVPAMAGAVLCTMNIRHDSAMLSVLLQHSEAKVFFVDVQFLETSKGALELLSETRAGYRTR
ncbi:hypothetical protein Taro_017631 [Colocasia esculenta]|uniref:Uncharacterized protein n=1 Tax=Colocasia esculenta TaxID=4460 RepID=A0A843URV2_COLES|nr:hypothetical protein [Colocasia esculenta]